jgi:DNA-binding transcriptional ArsR family regulator
MYYPTVPVAAETRLDALARVGHALADPTRCRLLLALLDGPAHPSELANRLGLGRANTSNHLSCLRGCGLVLAEPEGRHVRYQLADANLAHALRDLADMVLAVDVDQPCLNDNDHHLVATAEPRR